MKTLFLGDLHIGVKEDDPWHENIILSSIEQAIAYSKAKSYLFSIAHNAMIDSIRKSKREVVTDVSEMPKISVNSHYSDLKEVLDEALNRLPEVQRSVVLLRDYEGYSYEEIGEVTGLNESQVKVYIYRVRVFLKNYIGQIEAVI